MFMLVLLSSSLLFLDAGFKALCLCAIVGETSTKLQRAGFDCNSPTPVLYVFVRKYIDLQTIFCNV